MLLRLAVFAALACAQVDGSSKEPKRTGGMILPIREEGLSDQVVAPEKTIKERWEELYRAIAEAKQRNYSLFPVMIYSLEGQEKLPSRIIICENGAYQVVVEGVLEGVLDQDWKKSGRYWVTSKADAVREIARALKVKDKDGIKEIQRMIEDDASGAGILIYQYKRITGRERAPEEPRIGAPSSPIRPAPAPPTAPPEPASPKIAPAGDESPAPSKP